MKSWSAILEDVLDFAKSCGGVPFFRGQADHTWTLLPKIARRETPWDTECRMFLRFHDMAFHLFPTGATEAWHQLALMQHHGIPTRLLDWTESFAIALFFALREQRDTDAAIWALNPFFLNKITLGRETLRYLNAHSMQGDYDEYFLDRNSDMFLTRPGGVAAVFATGYSDRQRFQRSAFTMHFDLEESLEAIGEPVVRQFVLRRRLLPEARKFLQLSGINEFSLFHDLDAAGRYVVERELIAAD